MAIPLVCAFAALILSILACVGSIQAKGLSVYWKAVYVVLWGSMGVASIIAIGMLLHYRR